jgi:CPA1 family monovalent cation:H+ antiporter
MSEIEIIFGLVLVLVALVSLARRVRIPYPILLVIGGAFLGFVPGLPHVELEPELVFLLFLPPLLQAAAYFSSIRDFRANIRPIVLLAVGLPIFTTIVVGVAAHMLLPEMPWAVAFALGAIVSPPDAVAVAAIAQNVRLPRRIITLLEGESLVNDATALVAYRLAVAAVVTGTFSFLDAGLRFLLTGAGGVLVGLVLGVGCVWVMTKLQDPLIQIVISFLMSFWSYLLAETLGASGVMSVVTVGLILARNSPYVWSSSARLQGRAVWEIAIFLLNGSVFLLIGLQLNEILTANLVDYSLAELLSYAAIISLVLIVSRFVWVFPATYLPRFFSARLRARDPYPSWRAVTIVAWAGMRGVVSLAAALALPHETASGEPFPGRELIIFISFCVIFATLVLQGLSLPALIRLLGVRDTDNRLEREEAKARLKASIAAMERLEMLAEEEWTTNEGVSDLRAHYQDRVRLYTARAQGDADGISEELSTTLVRLQRELLDVERNVVIRMRDEGIINDDVLRRIERELDLEEQRLESTTSASH